MNAAATLIAAVALATTEPTQPSSYIWGGQQSCATWLSDAAQKATGNWWIWGYWSGLNVQSNGTVGHSTDANGVIGEIKLYCEAAPSTNLINATTQVYMRFKAQGR